MVPVLVGDLSPSAEAAYGRLFAAHLADPHALVVVSSDFCHWGERFRYTYLDPAAAAAGQPISHSIAQVDREGMRLIEAVDPAAFAAYLAATKNTICGRRPIAVLLHVRACVRG